MLIQKSIKFLSLLGLVTLSFFAIAFGSDGVRALASDKTNFIQECERRNILQGCNCGCRDSTNFPSGNELYFRCQKTASSCANTTTDREYAIFDSNGSYIDGYTDPNKVIVPKDQISTGSSRQFNFFPNLGNGLIAFNDDGGVSIPGTVTRVLFLVFLLATVIAIGIAFSGGFSMITAGGDDEKVQNGRNTFKNGVIGFIIAVAAVLLVAIASSALGFGQSSAIPDTTNITNPNDADEINDILENNSR